MIIQDTRVILSICFRLQVRKAHEEENKANEIAFINSLEAQNKCHDIITKHQDSEARLQDLQEERQQQASIQVRSMYMPIAPLI